jgi:integrase
MGSNAGHLWVDRGGRPMSGKAIRDQIKSRTRQAFGKAIWPHLFRDCAVTELVDCAPEEIGIAADLLGHADLQTTRPGPRGDRCAASRSDIAGDLRCLTPHLPARTRAYR